MKCIIIDDEQTSRELLASMLAKYCPDVVVCSFASCIDIALSEILIHRPEFVFLDIEMPGGNAFDLLDKFEKISFKIIFTTAYDHYALQALKTHAIDYLLKPLSISEVMNAVEKVKQMDASYVDRAEINKLLSSIKTLSNHSAALPIATSNGYELISIDDILYLEAHESYTTIILADHTKKVVSKNIGDLEQVIPSAHFFRIHHSFIVHKKYIKNYIRGEGGSVVLHTLEELPVSRRKKTEFIEWLTTT